MENSKPMSTPMFQKLMLCKEDGAEKVNEAEFRSLVGCLMCLVTTRPNILQAVSLLSKFKHVSKVHLQADKRVLRYVKGTLDYGVRFKYDQEFNFHGFFDSD
uniref:Retrovirus-related Pol polyprotein from transposon TNT 1-94 n=1 Tax=Cajanus cajan TaxID=3821 RepID=A0A151QYS7_CAJCA|nr:hypothetical protein KK1_043522 [Cajanus cajan]